MKIWIAYFLSVYIMLCAVVPCNLFDGCEEDEATEQTTNDSKKDCNSCSPFSFCSSGQGFTPNAIVTSVDYSIINIPLVYNSYRVSYRQGYSSSFFQPPKTAA